MKKLSTLLLALIATTALWASNVINYTASSKLNETSDPRICGLHTFAFEGSITSHTFSNGQGTITFSGEVTSIGAQAFGGCSTLVSINIPISVTSIGEKAFFNCNSLKSITIPDSVTSIESKTFSFCDSLVAVAIPNSVTSIGEYAFSDCKSLKSITIPDSVTIISRYAFSGCTSLSSITIPDSVTSIGDFAFKTCSSLDSILIPNSVTSIKQSAFRYCSSLASVTIGNSVTSIGYSAFSECKSLSSITCYATTPPTCGGSSFYEVDKTIPLYVPSESITAYQTADEWKDFTNIQAIGTPTFLPQLTDSPIHRFTKIMKNGQLLIQKDGKAYNTTGTKVR